MLSCMILLSLFTLSDTRCARADLSISTPQRMEALRGSCLYIPCNFTATGELNSTEGIDGLWRVCDRHGCDRIYNSNGRIRNYPMKITGDLAKKNCTTLFSSLEERYSGEYEFRIENGNVFKSSACSTHLQIQVKDSPPSPLFQVRPNLKEAESVTFTCSAPAPCPQSPPRLTWSLQGNTRRKLEQNPDGTFTVKLRQSVTLSERSDGRNISCSAAYPVDGETKRALTQMTLSVSYAPKDTSASVSPSALVSAGSLVTLSCSSRAKPPITAFTWFRRSEEGDSPEYKGHAYTFNVTEGGVYYCVAANNLGNQPSAEIQLTLIGDEHAGIKVDVHILLKALSIITLISSLIVFEFWFRQKMAAQKALQQAGTPQEAVTADYVNIDGNFTSQGGR